MLDADQQKDTDELKQRAVHPCFGDQILAYEVSA